AARGAAAAGPASFDSPVQVEEFAAGEEISVDAVVHRGRTQPLFLARKSVGYAPWFAEVGHRVDAADPLLGDQQVMQVLHAAHAAIGLRDGTTHTEMRLTPRGPKVIEINARLGGDLITLLGRYATGLDAGLIAADAACGRAPVLAPDRKAVAGVRFLHPPADRLTVGSLGFDAAALPPSVVRTELLVEPGATVSTPAADMANGRLAVAVAVAGTAGECEAALDAAEAALRLETA
ncbi:ATP-grasp domain-containing protein, partial [Actinomadura fibrosa]